MRVKTVHEREKVPIGPPGSDGLTNEDADELGRLEPGLPPGFLAWPRGKVQFGPFCGVLRVGELTLEILPKIARDSPEGKEARGVLIAMLRAAGELAEPLAESAPLGLQSEHLLDVFILDFCNRVNRLLHREAIRTYELMEENLTTVRGRLHLPEQFRRNLFDLGHVYCRYDELSADNPHNRALKAVLARLLPQAVGTQAKGAVNGLLLRLEDVSFRSCSASDISRLQFNRLAAPWRPIFKRAEELMRGLYPDVRAGVLEGPCLLFNMESLFEAFVGALLRRQWRNVETGGAQVVLGGPQRHFASASDGKPAFQLRPDITVVSSDDTRIYDAKWKELNTTERNRGVTSEDIYQMASYASRYRCGCLALLYPRMDGSPHVHVESFKICSPDAPRIDVHVLDLLKLVRDRTLPACLGPPA